MSIFCKTVWNSAGPRLLISWGIGHILSTIGSGGIILIFWLRVERSRSSDRIASTCASAMLPGVNRVENCATKSSIAVWRVQAVEGIETWPETYIYAVWAPAGSHEVQLNSTKNVQGWHQPEH